MNCATATCYRVRIINHITGEASTVETDRDRGDVLVDLMHLVRRVNRRRDETIRGCLRIGRDMIVLQWHCPWILGNSLAADLLEVAKPVHEAETLIVEGPQA